MTKSRNRKLIRETLSNERLEHKCMHGFHQGYAALEDLNKTYCPDVILLQEHWLAPSNLYKFDNYFTVSSRLVVLL